MSIRGMSQAAVTMNQLQQQMDVIGSNMANSSTNGYKAKKAEFSSLLFQEINNMTDPQNATGRMTPNGLRSGTGARLGGIHSDTRMGSLNQSERDLDVALLNENHFFEIDNRKAARDSFNFTRDGSFYLQPVNNGTELELVTKNGHHVMGSNGAPIRFAGNNVDSIAIKDDGTVVVKSGQEYENVGRISVVSIGNSGILESDGNNYYRLPEFADSGIGYGDVVQQVQPGNDLMQNGMLEMSNVDIADQMTNLVNAQRSYQFNARAISTADEMQGLINQMR